MLQTFLLQFRFSILDLGVGWRLEHSWVIFRIFACQEKESIYHTYWKPFFINNLLAFSCATGNENSIMIKSVELENDKKSLLPAIMNLTTHYIMWSWFQGWFLAWNYKKRPNSLSLFLVLNERKSDHWLFRILLFFFLFHKTYFIKVISFVMLWWKIIWFVIYKVLICDCIKNPRRWLGIHLLYIIFHVRLT